MPISLKVTTPEAAKLRGYTKPATLEASCYTLELLVKPDVDFDSKFTAFDINEGEMLSINGWLYTGGFDA